jgi:hypothetical protein
LTIFVQLRSEKLWSWCTKGTQIDPFCPAAQRKILELANKRDSSWPYLSSRAARNFGIGARKGLNQVDHIFPAAQREILELVHERDSIKLTIFVQPRSEKFWNWCTKGTQSSWPYFSVLKAPPPPPRWGVVWFLAIWGGGIFISDFIFF